MRNQLFMFSLMLVIAFSASVSSETYVTTDNNGFAIESSILTDIDAVIEYTQPISTGTFDQVFITDLALPSQSLEATPIFRLTEDLSNDIFVMAPDDALGKQDYKSLIFKRLIWPT